MFMHYIITLSLRLTFNPSSVTYFFFAFILLFSLFVPTVLGWLVLLVVSPFETGLMGFSNSQLNLSVEFLLASCLPVNLGIPYHTLLPSLPNRSPPFFPFSPLFSFDFFPSSFYSCHEWWMLLSFDLSIYLSFFLKTLINNILNYLLISLSLSSTTHFPYIFKVMI